jgi:hypothetical protein
MKQKHIFILENGNEITIWSGYSPDQTFAIIQDRKDFKNVKDLIENAHSNGWVLIEGK